MPRPDHASALSAIYATVAQPEIWPSTLNVLADHVGAAGGMMAYQNFAGPGSFLKVARLREDLTELYVRCYADNDYARAMLRRPSGRTVFGGELADHERMRRTAFYADILAPQKVEEIILVGHPALISKTTSGGFCFTLDTNQTEDRVAIAGRFQRLAPHLARAFDLSLELGRKLQAAWGLTALLGALPGAAVLIDRRGRVRQANEKAEALLARRDGLSLDREGHLSAVDGRENRDLVHLLKSVISVASGLEAGADVDAPRTASRITRRPPAAPLIVTATPLPPPAFSAWEALDSGARVLLRIVDPDESLDRSARVLRESAGLTATEARVAALVAEGRTTPEVAALLRLAPATVRTHLSHCFDKTGSRSQVALTRLLAMLAG